MAMTFLNQGEVQAAIDYYQRGLTIAQETGDRRTEAILCWNLGVLYEKTDPSRAVDLMSVLVAYEREIVHPDAEAYAERVEQIWRRMAGDG